MEILLSLGQLSILLYAMMLETSRCTVLPQESTKCIHVNYHLFCLHGGTRIANGMVLHTRPKIMTCSRLLKTGCNNVVLPTLFIVVNNIVQHC